MWVFLNDAYLSAVEDKDDASHLMVRARLRGDLQRTFPFAWLKVMETPNGDYRFRARVPRGKFEAAMVDAVRRIDYTNFKNSVSDTPRHNTYLRVWQVMLEAQRAGIERDKPASYIGTRRVFDGPLSIDDLCKLGDTMVGEEMLHEAARELQRKGPKKNRLGRALNATAKQLRAGLTRFTPGDVVEPVSPRGKKGSRPRPLSR